MAGAMIALNAGFPGGGVLADKCWSEEFKAAVGSPVDQEVVAVFLEHDALPARRVREFAALASAYDHEAHRNDALYENALLALGSPALGEGANLLYSNDFLNADVQSRAIVRNALLGNPLIHGSDGAALPNTVYGDYEFIHNAAVFGNFDNRNVATFFSQFLSRSRNIEDADIIFEALLSREHLPDDVLTAMYCHSAKTVDVCQRLVLREDHRKLVREDAVDGITRFADGKEVFCVASPDTPVERMEAEFALEDGWKPWSLLNSAACPRTIYQKALNL